MPTSQTYHCLECKKPLGAYDKFCRSCGTQQNTATWATSRTTPTSSFSSNYTSGYSSNPVDQPTNRYSSTPSYQSTASLLDRPAPVQKRVSGVWTFFGGSIYFAIEGWWKSAAIGVLLAIVTSGLSWPVLPFFAQQFVERIEGDDFGRTSGATPTDLTTGLKQLAELRATGVISDAEYQVKRSSLLNRL